jgi:hypothetical protein
MAWQAGRTVRGDLDRGYVRVKIKCRCGRSLGFVYGTPDRPVERYVEGSVPGKIVSNKPVAFRCHRRCGADYRVSLGNFRAAYKVAAAGPERVITLPLQPVARGKLAVRGNGSLVGSTRTVPAQHRA